MSTEDAAITVVVGADVRLEPTESLTTSSHRFSLYRFARRSETGAFFGTVAVFVFFTAIGGSKFLSFGGFSSWINVAAELGIVAVPVGVLMIAGELDLSVGSVLAGSSMTLAIASGYWHAPIVVGIIAALVVGGSVGLLNGVITTRTKVPSFVVTLGTNFGLAGLTLGLSRAITGTTSVSLTMNPVAHAMFGTLLFGQLEVSVFWCLGVALIVAWVLQKTPWGNWVFAIGGDQGSARAAGIPVAGTKIWLFVVSGLGAALVGIIQTALYNGAQTATGQSFVFNSIIAVVIGGVLLTGGYGSVIGVLFGTLTLAIVSEGIYYTGWNSDWANLILGVLLLAAVLLNNTFRRLALAGGNRSNMAPRTRGK